MFNYLWIVTSSPASTPRWQTHGQNNNKPCTLFLLVCKIYFPHLTYCQNDHSRATQLATVQYSGDNTIVGSRTGGFKNYFIGENILLA